MGVQDAKAPCSEHNETNTWCHGPDEFGNEVGAGIASAADDDPHDWACREHEHQHDGSNERSEKSEDSASETAGGPRVSINNRAIDRNE